MGRADKIKAKIFPKYQNYVWKYDDNTFLTAVRHNQKMRDSDICKDKATMLQHCSDIRTKCLVDTRATFPDKPTINKIPAGLKYHAKAMKKSTPSTAEELKEGLENLMFLLGGSTPEDHSPERLMLFSMVLSGYISRIHFKLTPVERRPHRGRAPVVRIIPHKDVFCGAWKEFEEMFSSLSVQVHGKNKLKLRNPVVLVSEYGDNHIDDCAYLCIKDDKKRKHFPTQYRDSAVLIHAGFFGKKDILAFIERNRWAAIFLFSFKGHDPRTPIIDFDLNKLSFAEQRWDKAAINHLMHHYIWNLYCVYKGRNVRKWFQDLEAAANRTLYQAQLAAVDPKIRKAQGKQPDMMRIQLVALRSFLDFCHDSEIIDDDHIQELWLHWCDHLLPGSSTEEIQRNKKEKGAQQETLRRIKREKSTQNKLEEILRALFDPNRCATLTGGEVLSFTKTYDINQGPWVFLSLSGKSKENQVPVAKVTRRALAWMQKRLNADCPYDNCDDIWAYLKQLKEQKVLPEYLQSVGNVRIPFNDTSKIVNGITILPEHLYFLDDDIRTAILARISEIPKR